MHYVLLGKKRGYKKKTHIKSQSQYFGKKSQLDYFPKSFSPNKDGGRERENRRKGEGATEKREKEREREEEEEDKDRGRERENRRKGEEATDEGERESCFPV